MNTVQDTGRNEGLKLFMGLVFVFFFLSLSGWALVNWLDEGPDIRYTPQAYTHHR